MTRETIEQYLDNMQQQAIALQQQADAILAQLTATNGAIQILEHILNEDEGDADVSPSVER